MLNKKVIEIEKARDAVTLENGKLSKKLGELRNNEPPRIDDSGKYFNYKIIINAAEDFIVKELLKNMGIRAVWEPIEENDGFISVTLLKMSEESLFQLLNRFEKSNISIKRIGQESLDSHNQ